MSIEDRDWFREKRIDYDRGGLKKSFEKKSPSFLFFVFLFILGFFSLFIQSSFYDRIFQNFPYQDVPVSIPVQVVPSPLVLSESFFIGGVRVSKEQYEQEMKTFEKRDINIPPEKEKNQIVSSVQGGYQGYIEANGVKKEVYSKTVVSETYRFQSLSNHIKYLDVEINGVPTKIMLDTGASSVVVNSETLRLLNLKEFTGSEIRNTANGSVYVSTFPCSIRLGSFLVQNIKCDYNKSNSNNLLGGSFLKNFNYTINESENTITFTLR